MNAVVPMQTNRAVQPVLVPTNFDQLVRFSEMAAQSELVPRDYRGKPSNIMIAVQMGSEIGLSPVQSLLSIAVVNGRPGLWGDGLIGMCRQSPLCEDIVETIDGEGDNRTAVCVARRRGSTPTTGRFSVADAKRAGLFGKAGTWTQYPDRMLQNRARGFALRDAFPDVLRGLKTVEELRDTPADSYQGQTLQAEPAPARHAPAQRQVAARAPDAVDDDAIPNMDAPTPDRALQWLEAQLTKLAAVTFLDELHLMARDAKVYARLAELEAKRPELAARYNDAMKVALETLTEVEGGE